MSHPASSSSGRPRRRSNELPHLEAAPATEGGVTSSGRPVRSGSSTWRRAVSPTTATAANATLDPPTLSKKLSSSSVGSGASRRGRTRSPGPELEAPPALAKKLSSSSVGSAASTTTGRRTKSARKREADDAVVKHEEVEVTPKRSKLMLHDSQPLQDDIAHLSQPTRARRHSTASESDGDAEMADTDALLPPSSSPPDAAVPASALASPDGLNGLASLASAVAIVGSVAHSSRASSPAPSAAASSTPRDPALLRLRAAYIQPQAFERRMKKNWSSMRDLMPAAQATAQRARAERAKVDEFTKAAEAAAAPAGAASSATPLTSPAPTSASAEPSSAAAAAKARRESTAASAAIAAASAMIKSEQLQAAKASPLSSPKSSAAAPAATPQTAHKKKRSRNLDLLRGARPNSCPPIMVRPQAAQPAHAAWPQWMQVMASPRAKEESTTDAKDEPPTYTLPASFHTKHAAAAVTVKIEELPSGTRPVMARASTAAPASWMTSASAPSTPAVTGAFRDLPSHVAFFPPRPQAVAASPMIDGFAVPAPPAGLPRGLSLALGLASPSLSGRSSVSSAIGSRPTPSPLVLPSTSSSHRPLPRFGDSTQPLFGDSTLITSIPSSSRPPPVVESAAALAAASAGQQALASRGLSLVSPGVRPMQLQASAASPMSPIARTSTTASSTAASTSAADASLAEWLALSVSYVESHLKPPTLTALANASRQSRAALAAALDKFAPPKSHNPATAMEVDSVALESGVLQPTSSSAADFLAASSAAPASTTTGVATAAAALIAAATATPVAEPTMPGSMPPPMSPLPSRHVSLPPPHQTTPSSSPRPLPLQLQARGSSMAAANAANAPFSPNIARMSSWLHTHTAASPAMPTPSRMVSQQPQTPMSPLGLAQSPRVASNSSPPSLSRQATTLVADTAAIPTPSTPAPAVVAAASSAAAAAPPHSSRVGSNYQADVPAMLTQKQREWERAAYLHAHAAVHGFPRHLPPLPREPSSSSPAYLPVPRVPLPPYALASFPASASLAFTSRRSHLREALMGGRRAARRKQQKAEGAERQRHQDSLGQLTGRRGGARGGGGTAPAPSFASPLPTITSFTSSKYPLTEKPPPNLDLAEIWPWTWEEWRQRELENERRQIKALRGARKRNRDERRDGSGGAAASDQPVASPPTHRKARYSPSRHQVPFASLFPADSPFAKMHFDDDTLSPYFVCAAHQRPASPKQNPRVRPTSPVHVLSVPPTPIVRGRPSLLRFPSSLLDPTDFSRRVAALARGEEDDLESEEDDDVAIEEDVRRHRAQRESLEQERDRERAAARRARAGRNINYAEYDEDDLEEEEYKAPSGPHRNARSVKPTPRHAPPCSSPPVPVVRKTKPGPGSGSSQGHTGAALAAPFGPNAGRFKRWAMVGGKRIVWWIDAAGKTVLGEPPEGYTPPTPIAKTSAKSRHVEEEEEDEDPSESEQEDDAEMEEESESGSESKHQTSGDDSDHESDASDRIVIKRSRLPPSSVHAHSSYHRARVDRAAAAATNDALAAAAAAFAARPRLQLSDLSPIARVLAARTGVARMIRLIEEVFEGESEDLDEPMERAIGRWRAEGLE